jgi:hypothetical protein
MVLLVEWLGLKYSQSAPAVNFALSPAGSTCARYSERQGRARHSTRPTYALTMLRRMRDETGGPNIKTRLVALLAAVGLLVVTAPVVVPLVRWIADQIW